MKRSALVCLLALVVLADSGCSDSKPGISVSIAGQFRRSNGAKVDLVEANPNPWDRVCIMGPGSSNNTARNMLGFEWSPDDHSVIRRNDGISLLIFAKGNQVVDFVEHPRNLGDFANLTGQCYAPEKAVFYQANASEARKAGLYPRGQ